MDLKALLEQLQATHECGLVALQLPDVDSTMYLWWGSRPLCLGLTSRLAHGINCELENMEEGTDETGPKPASDTEGSLAEFPHNGMYL